MRSVAGPSVGEPDLWQHNAMFTNWSHEREIRHTLRRLSRQRVGLILQPGNVWVIENAVVSNNETDAALCTCRMRGWVEILENSLLAGQLTADGRLPDGPIFTREKPLFGLTDSGWGVIHRTHGWIVCTFIVSLAGLAATAFSALTHTR
jgi:hypothetical protein